MNALRDWLQLQFEMPSGNRLESMEGMRGFAALLVFLVHFQTLFGNYATTRLHSVFSILGSLGHTGVDLFFVLSGYLIYGIVLSPKFRYWQYFRRRLRRLYPVFAVVFAIYLILLSAGAGSDTKGLSLSLEGLRYVAANLLMLPGMLHIRPLITVAWSLSYEWFLYLSLPLWVLLLRGRTRTPRWRITAVCLIVAVYAALCLVNRGDCPRLILFGAGILLWESHKGGYFWKLGRTGEILSAAAFIANLVLLGIVMSQGGEATVIPLYLPDYYSPSLFISLFFFSAYSLIYKGMLSELFSWRPLRWVGNMSYSYYLIHGLALHGLRLVTVHLFGEAPLHPALFCLLLITAQAVVLVAAAVLYLGVERPLSLSQAPSSPAMAAKPQPALLSRS